MHRHPHHSWKLYQLVLKVIDIGFEIVLPHFDGEGVVIVLLDFPVRGVLGEEHLGYLLEVVERM